MILIAAAMESELSFVRDSLDNSTQYIYLGYEFCVGKLKNTDVAIVKTEQNGLNALIAILYAANQFSIDYIINIGCAGAHKDFLNIGDIIVSDKIYNTTVANIENDGSTVLRNTRFYKNGELIKIGHYSSDDKLALIALSIPYEYRVYRGNLAYSDLWRKSKNHIKEISKITDSYAEDMESGAIAHFANMSDISFLSIRVISNNELTGASFTEDCLIPMQKFVIDFLNKSIK